MHQNTDTPAPRGPFERHRVFGGCLIVDDDSLSRAFVAGRLTRLGVSPTFEAAAAAEALQLWLERRPTVVFIDCVLPEWDGYSLAREIRFREQRFHQAQQLAGHPTLLIGMSGNSGQVHLARCEAAGMDRVLGKPASIEAFAATLGLAVSKDAPPIADEQQQAERVRASELSRLFASTASADLLAIENALISGRVDAVARHAHRISGASRLVGAGALGDAAQRLVDAARLGNAEILKGALSDVAKAYENWKRDNSVMPTS